MRKVNFILTVIVMILFTRPPLGMEIQEIKRVLPKKKTLTT